MKTKTTPVVKAFRLRNIALASTLFFCATANQANAQTFTETMGTAPSTTLISAHEAANGFDNDGFTMTGTGDVRNTSPSTGYSGSSGLANVFITNIAGRNFQIADINTSLVTNPTLSFGISKSTIASNGSDLVVEVSTDGITYTTVSYPALPTGTGTAIWHYRTVTSVIPSAANLRIRFTNTGTVTQYRIDDVSVSGTVSCSATITAGGPTTFCAGGSVTLTASAGNSYLWSTGATTQSIVATTSGTYSVTVISAGNCSASASINVTVNPVPAVAASASLPVICAGGTTTLTATGAVTYNWQPGNQGGSSVNVSPASSTTYTVTGTNANGCSSTATVNITVNPGPAVTITSSGAVCAGGNTTLTASGASTYTWQPGSLSGNSITVSPAVSTVYTATGTDTNGCTGTSAPLQVVVYPAPAVLASAIDSEFCIGGSTTLNARTLNTDLIFSEYVEGTSNEKYIEIYNGTGSTVNLSDYEYRAYHNGISTPSFTTSLSGTLADGATLVLKNGSALLYTGGTSVFGVQHNGNDALALYKISTSSFVDIFGVIDEDPGTAWTGTPSYTTVNTTLRRKAGVYSGITINSGISGVNGFTTLTTEWDQFAVNDVSGLGAHTVSGVYSWSPVTSPSTGSSVTATPPATTSYTVTGSLFNGCTANDDVTIVVNPLPVITISGDNTICTGETTSLTASGANTYVWSTTETTASISVNPAATTVYSVTGTDANGCTSSASETVTVNPLPTVAASASPATLCAGGSATLTATGATSYNWQPGNLGGSSVSVTPSAATTYTVTGTDGNGCSASATVHVTVNEAADVAIESGVPVIYLCYGPACSSLTADAVHGTGPFTFLWSTGATTSAISVCPAATTTYTVTMTDANGCTSSETVEVTVIDACCGNSRNPKVIICHNGNEICVSANAVPAHLAHGDVVGPCNNHAMESIIPEESEHGMEAVVYPNPSNADVTIRIHTEEAVHATVTIKDITGKTVATVFNGTTVAGDNNYTWSKSGAISSGVYICEIVTQHETKQIKLAISSK